MARDLSYTLNIGGVAIKVTPKPIKYLRLKVCPPDGEARASAPFQISEAEVAAFALSKLAWIRKRRAAIANAAAPDYESLETFFVWGEPVLLNINENASSFGVDLKDRRLRVHLKGKADKIIIATLLQAWYKSQTMLEARKRLDFWTAFPRPKKVELQIRKMKTRWGSCAPLKGKIVLNSELAKKPPVCLDYVVAHELAHFSVPNHSKKFWTFLGSFFPNWKEAKKLLKAPLARGGADIPAKGAERDVAHGFSACGLAEDLI